MRRTRIPIWMLVLRRNAGISDWETLSAFPALTQADLDAAWEYYESHPAEIHKAIRENQEA